jgi:hypothetical protein
VTGTKYKKLVKYKKATKKKKADKTDPQKNKSQTMHHAGKRVWLQQNIGSGPKQTNVRSSCSRENQHLEHWRLCKELTVSQGGPSESYRHPHMEPHMYLMAFLVFHSLCLVTNSFVLFVVT